MSTNKRNCSDGLSCMGMNEMNYLQRVGSNAKRNALSQVGCRRPHKEESAEVVTSNTRPSQPSGEVV
jgi:hypothetical protein